VRYNFDDLSNLPIQDAHFCWCMIDGHAAGRDPSGSFRDCPYGPSTDTRIRCYRVAWRTAFRRASLARCHPTSADAFMAENSTWKAAA
jgi:hypothetical protein